jgi:mono/diheme cytochrome c family protein
VGPDGALYVADDKGGRIWRVTYDGARTAKIAAAAPVHASVTTGTSASPPEGVHPNAGATALPIPPDGSPDQVALGDRIFHGQADGGTCVGCHGADGKGSPVGSDLTSGKWVWSDGSVASIAHVIRTGVAKPTTHTGVMPPSGGISLSDADLTAVADYVWAIGHRTGK